MKHEDKVSAIKKTIKVSLAQKAFDKALSETIAVINGSPSSESEYVASCAIKAHAAKNNYWEAKRAIKNIAPELRAQATEYIKKAEELALSAARCFGKEYSGTTKHLVIWGDQAEAYTNTSRGVRYSCRCTYKRTNATHIVQLDPEGVPLLIDRQTLVNRSNADGLPLIALYPDNRAVWLVSQNKRIVSESGWIYGDDKVCYHSTKSLEDAKRGYDRKLKILKQEEIAAKNAAKIERRARLIVRLCGNALATIADAKAMGYCMAGIRAFQERHGIGDTATLLQLIKTGESAAVALALSVARKIALKKEIKTQTA